MACNRRQQRQKETQSSRRLHLYSVRHAISASSCSFLAQGDSPGAVRKVQGGLSESTGTHLANEAKSLFRTDSLDRSSVVASAENAEVYEILMRQLQPLYRDGDRSKGSGLVDDTCAAGWNTKTPWTSTRNERGSSPQEENISYLEQLLVIHFQDRLAGTRKGHAPQQLGSLKRQCVHIFGGRAVHDPLASEGGALGLGLGRSLREHTFGHSDIECTPKTRTRAARLDWCAKYTRRAISWQPIKDAHRARQGGYSQ